MKLTEQMIGILEKIKIPRNIIEVIKSLDSIELLEDKENILKIKLSPDVAYELYCEDFIESSSYNIVNMMDIVYSSCRDDSFNRAYRRASDIPSLIANDKIEDANTNLIAYLVCYILVKVNDHKYSKLKTIEDVTDPVPFQIYMNLLNKSKDNIEVYTNVEGIKYAGILQRIRTEKSMMGVSVYADINIISKSNADYVEGIIDIQICPNAFVSNLEDLGLHAVTDEIKAELTKRGRKYVELTKEPTYCECHGEGYSQGWMEDIRHRIDSRVMIDVAAFKLLNPTVNNVWFEGELLYSDDIIGKDVPEDMLWACAPAVYGFSFGNKVWCKMFVENMKDIVFADNAFDDLIIPEEYKELFVASLTNDMPSLDSISGKGAGKIFLLYGAPGVGKTMTAESVAEFLRKPLYFVSVGELGVDPESLEKSLDKVMKVASSWDAIILLDEVDVFAVKREGASIERNAMTAIFLRMLERYTGVMFMTTNLLNNLDDAFISRSTAVIKYNDLTASDRANIWESLIYKVRDLKTIGIDCSEIDLKELAKHDINGRVIKNTVRLAYSLAASKKEPLSMKHIEAALRFRQC